jgi:hypothetical protein
MRNVICVMRMKPDCERICPHPALPAVWLGYKFKP